MLDMISLSMEDFVNELGWELDRKAGSCRDGQNLTTAAVYSKKASLRAVGNIQPRQYLWEMSFQD